MLVVVFVLYFVIGVIMVSVAEIASVGGSGQAYAFRLAEFVHSYVPYSRAGLGGTDGEDGLVIRDWSSKKVTWAGARDLRVEYFCGSKCYFRLVSVESNSFMLTQLICF